MKTVSALSSLILSVLLSFSQAGNTDIVDSSITDGDYSTVYEFNGINMLSAVSDDEFLSVYLIWDNTPEKYTIETDKETINCGENGFMHELVRLSEPSRSLKITADENGRLCDMYIFAEGDLPDWVQDWQKPLERADILLLSTHSDDELLMFGGTLPYYAGELKTAVQVAYLTDHSAEPPRPHELLDGLWAAGVKTYPVIGTTPDIQCWSLDAALNIYDRDLLLEWTVDLIRRVKPSVLITHDVNGEYGHGAHMLSAYLVREAIELSGSELFYPESFEKYGSWDVLKTYLHLWEENEIVMDWDIPLDSFGGSTARDVAAAAYLFHKSQQKWGYSVNYNGVWDCRRFGLYNSLVGSDTKSDFMDNIRPISELYAEPVVETEINTESETVPKIETETENINEIEKISETSIVEIAAIEEKTLESEWNSEIFVVFLVAGTVFALIAFYIILKKRNE